MSAERRDAFYAAAVAGLDALDARERVPRRFGTDADTRWASFRGALNDADRIDLLLRDAAVTQRLEDQGILAPELMRLGLKASPVPDQYTRKDFLRHFWRLRGKLDVPRDRFVTVACGTTDDDPTPPVGRAGWDHLQTAQALAVLYQRRKTEDGWTGARLVALLAVLAERVPWLLRWHDEPSAAYGGSKVGRFLQDFAAGEAHTVGISAEDLRARTPSATPRGKSLDSDEVYVALLRWTPEVAEDGEDDGREPPEGPTPNELASDIRASKELVTKALKKLGKAGGVEKLAGRPARYIATGDDA